MKRQVLTVLQAGRALAAFAVVAHHATLGTEAFVADLPRVVSTVTEQGYLGVDFFFVLSGFIIYYTNHDRPKDRDARRWFVWHRVVRIFAPYLPIGIAMVAIYTLLPDLSAGSRDWSLLASIFLLPAQHPPALNVAWTLQHELVFYALFAIFFFSNRLAVGIAAWVLAIIVLAGIGLASERPVSILAGTINLEFLFGMLAAHAVIHSKVSSAICAILGTALLLAFIFLGAARDASVIVGLGIAFLIIPIVRAELAGLIAVGPLLLFFGDASYSLYLLNNSVVSVTSRIATRLPLFDTWLGAMLLAFVASAAAAAGYHLLLERPLLARARRVASRSPGRALGRSDHR